ncbi:MAG: hypothetical protein E7490_04640 [Ruminococcaceae bacterium]|nr:hypothetical protein [Oscillospiraceae bacterium]
MTKKNTVATIATIIVALLALSATFFLLYKMSQEQAQENDYVYVPSEEINNEMNDNAVTLIKNNCEIFRVFLQYGLAHEAEPYNNKPEDKLYTVKSDKYSTMADLEKLVKSTFVEKEAERILTNVNGNGPVFSEETNYDGEKGIGLAMDMVDKNGRFKGITYEYSWTNPKVILNPVSNTECELKIELEKENTATESGAESTVEGTDTADTLKLSATMIKANGKWLLQKLTY